MTERLLSAETVADRLGCSKNQVYSLAKQGKLKFFKLGSLLRIREADFEEALTKMTSKTANNVKGNNNV